MTAPWPKPRQELVLVSALGDPARAEVAWNAWLAGGGIQDAEAPDVALLPQVYRNLAAVDDLAHRDRVRGVYRQRWARNQARLAAATSLLGDLAEAGTEPVVVGAAALLLAPGADPAALDLDRVDVLFSTTAQADAALALLRDSGATVGHPQPHAKGRARAIDSGGARLRLHWPIAGGLVPRAAGGATPLHAAPVRAVTTPDTILFCTRFGLHRSAFPMRWLAEVALALRSDPGLDWAALTAGAAREQQAMALGRTLAYLRDRVGLALPAGTVDGVLRAAGPADRLSYARRALRSRTIDSLNSRALTPGEELVALVASPPGRPHREDRLRRLAGRSGLNWTEVLNTAERNHLVALLALDLARPGVATLLPAAVRSTLAARLREVTVRNLSMAAELRRVSAALAGAGIPFAAYKGPVLAIQAFGDLKARQFRDLDIATQPRDLDRAVAVLLELGFSRFDTRSVAGERLLRRTDNHLQFEDRSGHFLVELHWSVMQPQFGLDLETTGLWTRTTTARVAGVDIPTFSAEDTLLLLLVHGAKHHWSRLEWLSSIARLVQQDLDWELLCDLAERLHATRAAALGLILVRDLLGARLPAAADELVSAGGAEALAGEVMSRGWLDPSEPARRLSLFHVRVRDRNSDRIRQVLSAASPTADDGDALPLPPALDLLYPLTRVVRLGVRTLRR